MLRTKLCNIFGIEFPIIQAGMGVFTSAELVAAVSNAGGLGSLAATRAGFNPPARRPPGASQ